MDKSTRLKMTIFSTIILAIVGVIAYIFDPAHIDKYAFYNINTVIPLLSYIGGRTIRSGNHEGGFVVNSTRYKVALYTFIGSLLIGIGCYIFSPENIDKLGSYMMAVVITSAGFIIGRSIKSGNPQQADSNKVIEP